MTLSENNAVQLWRKAEADTRDAGNLFLSPIEDEYQKVCAILAKLRAATAAMTTLEVKVRNHYGQR